MKKMMLLGVLLMLAARGYAQESRQDVSFSGTGFFGPQVNGNGAQLNTNGSLGLLTSYRYMLTPHSALELNYSFTQNQQRYVISFSFREPPEALRLMRRGSAFTRGSRRSRAPTFTA